MAIVNGTAGNDDLFGTDIADEIYGLAGMDTLYGFGGNDLLHGGSGVDTMRGGAGDDTYIVDARLAAGSSTVFALQGQAGAAIVQSSHVYTPGGGTFSIFLSDFTHDGLVDTLRLYYSDAAPGGDWYALDLSTRTLDRNLAPGEYTFAQRYPFEERDHPGLTLSGNGSAPNAVFGSFTINEAVFDYSGAQPALLHFSVAFEQRSGSPDAPSVLGTFNYNYGSASAAPEPVIERANEGADTVRSSIDYVLPDNVENLVLTGTQATKGTGNALGNEITGNSAANTLDGGGGFDGLAGGAGNDTYIVDRSEDLVVEAAGGGDDRVISSASYVLPDHVERLALTGSAALYGTGNDAPNILAGNAGDNLLVGAGGGDVITGGAGTDGLDGGAGGDRLDGGAGFDYAKYDYAPGAVLVDLGSPGHNSGDAAGDRYLSIEGVVGSRYADTLVGDGGLNDFFGGDGNDTIQGRGGSDNLQGGNGNDQLEGGAGGDALKGGAGYDYARYRYATSGVTADLAASAANTAEAAGDRYTSIEGLLGSLYGDVLRGDAYANDLTGLDGDDGIQGRSGNDILKGGNGNDTLDGGAGLDRLSGGSGNDVFVSRRGEANGDAIIDFGGDGAAAGDRLVFQGYGTAAQGARFVMIDATHWRIDSSDGAVHDVLTLVNAAPVHASDYTFV